MEQIPVLVDEFGVARLQNAVYVGLMKFTLDQCNANFDHEENPAPPKLTRQIASYTGAYNMLNNAYALQMKRMETADIAALDTEGNQLIYGVKGLLESMLRMTYDQERLSKAQVFNEFVRNPVTNRRASHFLITGASRNYHAVEPHFWLLFVDKTGF